MEEVPLLIDLHTKYGDRTTIIGISVDTNLQRVDEVIKERAMTWPILADGNGFDGPIATAYHIQGTPDLFVLDRQGRIFVRLGSAKQLEARLKEALNTP
jgi:hypothetical protein